MVIEHLQAMFLNNDAIKNEAILQGVALINICLMGPFLFLFLINANKTIREIEMNFASIPLLCKKNPLCPYFTKNVLY